MKLNGLVYLQCGESVITLIATDHSWIRRIGRSIRKATFGVADRDDWPTLGRSRGPGGRFRIPDRLELYFLVSHPIRHNRSIRESGPKRALNFG
jgi:hypothetical protein